MYTKEQLQGMSDGKLRVIIYEKFGVTFDDANALLPVALKHKINIGPADDDEWYALHCKTGGMLRMIEFNDYSPCRAIACCLILVLQDKE